MPGFVYDDTGIQKQWKERSEPIRLVENSLAKSRIASEENIKV
jgi:TPP-dependent pyruvate/acetoin dehydrogenase alpha subunit